MKKIILIGLLAAAMQFTICTSYAQDPASDEYQSYQDDDYYQTDNVSYQTFYNDLSQYGQWINYPNYGSVWQPAVGSDFRPYGTNGHWVYSDMGWTWSSDFEWGWAAFHYGRWFYDSNYGWLWVPGYDWAPAWVSWRSNADYYGWAPLMPNVSIDVCFSSYRPPMNYWSFVPNAYIASANVYNYYVSTSRYTTIINNTTIVNNRYERNNRVFATGPSSTEVERFTHHTIRPIALSGSNRQSIRINNDQLHIFRPRVNNTAVQRMQQRTALVNEFRSSGPTQVPGGYSGQARSAVHFSATVNNRPEIINRNNSYANNHYSSTTRDNAAYLNRSIAGVEQQNAFQRQVQQRSNAPLVNESASRFHPQVRTMPVERPNVNAFRQSQPVQQRSMSRPPAPAFHSFAPAPANRNLSHR
jgi:hypothetical protein